MFDYSGRKVVVSGASSGIGREIALAYARLGADVAVLARRVDRLEQVAKEIEELGVKAFPIQCDVTDDEQIANACKQAKEALGKFDVLVNVAGSSKAGSVLEMTNEAWDFTIEVDLTSVFKVTREFAKDMVENGYGRIINIASMYGLLGTNQHACAYHASKAGVINYTRAAAAELGKQGVTVNSICPGYIMTELTEETMSTDDFKQYTDLTVPLGRYGETKEIAAAAAFLGSEEASYVTGVALPVDGGWSSCK